MTFRIVWTNPLHKSENLPEEAPEVLEWDSRDMAQLAATISGGPKSNPRRFSAFRVEEVPLRAPAGKRK